MFTEETDQINHLEKVVNGGMTRGRDIDDYEIKNFVLPYFPQGLNNQSVIVDFGCGDGYFIFDVSRRYDCFSIGIDKRKADTWGELQKKADGSVIYYQGNVDDTRLPSDSMDLVTCNMVLQYTPDKLSLLREAHRLLKIGGQAIFYYAEHDDYISPSWDDISIMNGGQLKPPIIHKTPMYSIDRRPRQDIVLLLEKKEKSFILPKFKGFSTPKYCINDLVVMSHYSTSLS